VKCFRLFVQVVVDRLLQTWQIGLLVLQLNEVLVRIIETPVAHQVVDLVEDELLKQLDLLDAPPITFILCPRFVDRLHNQLSGRGKLFRHFTIGEDLVERQNVEHTIVVCRVQGNPIERTLLVERCLAAGFSHATNQQHAPSDR